MQTTLKNTILAFAGCFTLCLGSAFAQSGTALPAQYGTPFAHVPDREDAVIYQVNMRAFSQRGNFAGVTARLDSIAALGVNVIYIMPIYPVGSYRAVNSPYCIKDYTSVNAEFGNVSDLRRLIDGAHQRNMSVLLDWVGNHTAWDHPWIIAHPDWYWHDSTGKIAPPRPDWKDVAQLDFSNKDMRQEMIADMKYWVYAANIDGFRCDFADNPPADFWKQAIDTLKNIRTHKLLFLAEGTRSANYSAGFDYNFGFAFFGNLEDIYNRGKSALVIDTINEKDYIGATDGRQIVRYTTNHDVNGSDGTPQHLFGGKEGAMGAFAVVSLMKGIPMIYNGQEVGMEEAIPFPFTSVKIMWDTDPAITAFYKKIIDIHKNNPAIKHGLLTSFSTDDICAFTKTGTTNTVFVLANVRNEEINYRLPETLTNTTWTNAMDGSNVSLHKKVTVPAYGYLILEKKQ